MITTEAESYWEGLNPRERFLFDLLNTGVAAALGGDESELRALSKRLGNLRVRDQLTTTLQLYARRQITMGYFPSSADPG